MALHEWWEKKRLELLFRQWTVTEMLAFDFIMEGVRVRAEQMLLISLFGND